MIRLQSPLALPGYLLIGSDMLDVEAARREVAAWADASGCTLTVPPRRLSVFHGDHLVREWTLIPLPTHAVPRVRGTAAFAMREHNLSIKR